MDQMLGFTNDDCNILFCFGKNYLSSIGVLVHKHQTTWNDNYARPRASEEPDFYKLLATNGNDECTVEIQLDTILK